MATNSPPSLEVGAEPGEEVRLAREVHLGLQGNPRAGAADRDRAGCGHLPERLAPRTGAERSRGLHGPGGLGLGSGLGGGPSGACGTRGGLSVTAGARLRLPLLHLAALGLLPGQLRLGLRGGGLHPLQLGGVTGQPGAVLVERRGAGLQEHPGRLHRPRPGSECLAARGHGLGRRAGEIGTLEPVAVEPGQEPLRLGVAGLLQLRGAIDQRPGVGRELDQGAGERVGVDGDGALGVERGLLALEEPSVGRRRDRIDAGDGCVAKSHGPRVTSSPVPAPPGRHPAVLDSCPPGVPGTQSRPREVSSTRIRHPPGPRSADRTRWPNRVHHTSTSGPMAGSEPVRSTRSPASSPRAHSASRTMGRGQGSAPTRSWTTRAMPEYPYHARPSSPEERLYPP